MSKKRRNANSAKMAKARTRVKRSARRAMARAVDTRKTAKQRVAAMAAAPLAVCDSDKDLQAMLKVLRSTDEPVQVRLAALQSLQAASFSVVAFEACRGDFTAALRAIAQDADPEIRQRALGMLARDKDGFAERKLLEGLRDPSKALVPPEKALQLLSYDVHAEAYPLAREIVRKPPNPMARREALRLLAADATAAPLFEKILRDKAEASEIRQISASALHSLEPAKLQGHAREILLDPEEHADIQATSLTALTQFGDSAKVAADAPLMRRVGRLRGTGSTLVKRGARRFLSKYVR